MGENNKTEDACGGKRIPRGNPAGGGEHTRVEGRFVFHGTSATEKKTLSRQRRKELGE